MASQDSIVETQLLSGLDYLDQGILIVGPDLIIRAANKAHQDIFGLPDGFATTGSDMRKVYTYLADKGNLGPGDPKKIVAERLKRFEDRNWGDDELHLPDGRIIEVRRTALPDGGMVAVSTDVTERRNAADALRTSEQRFRDIAEIASDWFWEMDADLRFSYFSDRNVEILGFDMSTIIGKKRTDVTPENVDSDKWQAHLDDMAAHRPFKDFRYDINPDGLRTRHISISGKPFFTPDGVFLGYRGVGRDLTRDNAAETALKENVSVLQATLDATADGILVADLERRAVQAVNQQFIEMFQVPDELISEGDGWKLRDWIAELVQDPTAYHMNVDKIFAEPEKEFRTQLVMKDGRIIDRYTRPQYMGETIIGRVISFRDITEQFRTAQELQSQKTLLETVFRDVPDAMVLADADSCVRMCNPAFTNVFGYEIDGVIGRTAEFLYENQDVYERDGCARIAAADDNDQDSEPYIVPYRRKDGQVFPGETMGSSLRTDDGSIIGYVAVIRDVSARIKADQERREALEMAEDANRSKSAFLANVSHDLRTPLNAILGFSEIIKQQILGPIGHEKYIEYAEDIRDSGAYLLDLVNDLLDISTIEAGQRTIQPERIDLNQFIYECMKAATGRALNAALVTEDLADDLPALVADRRAIKQVILNLLANALKFTPATGHIVLKVRHDKERFRFSVIDTGKGIAKENLTRISAAFERGQTSAYSTADGTGLGLAIARSLIELHGGELIIESEVGKGTVVSFDIPGLP
ncbi:MAG: PAS-domain containing protein [Rhodospirillales bacterium]